MAKGEGNQTKVHYKGAEDDFVIFVVNAQIVRDWQGDKSIPLAQVVDSFKIFVTHKHGAQGTFDEASNSTLENEFGTKKDDEAIKQILEKGTIQESETAGRQGPKNDNQGARVAH
ncbi:MAG: hypothetical protein M1818_008153 [Claussenomyces sp. TS43310]|nr:MAG: hypothetical protein M1818_008153 [Claussenomyces sp. TS43310]